MHRWGQRQTPLCPRCNSVIDSQHVWVCKSCDSRAVWESALASLKSWMTRENTDPDVQFHILQHLQAWWDYTPEPSFISSFFKGHH
jgi:tRNA(Ile2) C34 agmatinyltransferase TiaS